MLLETQQILESLQKANWNFGTTHPDLKRPGKAAALHAFLAVDGSQIASLEFTKKEETLLYWTQANGNHNSFPVAKLTGPLAQEKLASDLTAWSRERDAEKRTAMLQSWLAESYPGSWPAPFSSGMISKLLERREELNSLKDTDAAPFLALLDIVTTHAEERGRAWTQSLIERLTTIAVEGSAELQPIAQGHLVDLLYSDKSVPIIWDLPLIGLQDTSASSPANFTVVNQALLHALPVTEANVSVSGSVCALTHSQGALEDDKFPQLTLPGIGKTYLFARNRQTPSLERYGASGPSAFSVNREHTRKLAGALQALTAEERRGKTWTLVAAEQPKKSDLLLAFQRGLEDEPVAEAIGTDQRAINEAQFQEFTKRILTRTRGDTTDQLRGHLALIVLRAVDPGNRKVIMRANLQPEPLERAAKSWGEACCGVVGRKLFVPISKGKPAILAGPPVLNPGAIPALTRRVFRADAASTDSAGGLSFSDALGLLLGFADGHDEALVSRALAITRTRLAPLLNHLAETANGRAAQLREMPPELRWIALKTQSLFSLLLSASNRPPNTTMNSAAYRLGQLCAAFDVIHSAYCHVERGGDLPPHFIGNAAFQAASRNPIGALGQLCQRAGPYQAWLKSLSGERKAKAFAAHPEKSDGRYTLNYALKLRGDQTLLSRRLKEVFPELSTTVTDVFRSELLLGYLAGPSDPETLPSEKDEPQNNPNT